MFKLVYSAPHSGLCELFADKEFLLPACAYFDKTNEAGPSNSFCLYFPMNSWDLFE